MTFRNYTGQDYEAVCDFLIELNSRDSRHINWNWARFEWMAEHPEFDRSLAGSIGLWYDGAKVVGAAIYDMYFGEGFAFALPDYSGLYPEILDYACSALRDESGFAMAICDDSPDEIAAAVHAGFTPSGQSENVMRIALDGELAPSLPDGLEFASLDPADDPIGYQWLLWQGFDHGSDREEFLRDEGLVREVNGPFRRHFDPRLSVAAVEPDGQPVAYCCLWLSPRTDYAYVEPVCAVPAFRGRGVGKAVVREALRRAKALGARSAFVISDMDFYRRLGFKDDRHFTFYQNRDIPTARRHFMWKQITSSKKAATIE